MQHKKNTLGFKILEQINYLYNLAEKNKKIKEDWKTKKK